MANPLNSRPKVRRALLDVQWGYNGAVAVLGAYFAVNQTPVDHLPHWYVVAIGVAPALWTYLGLTARGNVDVTTAPPTGDSDPGAAGADNSANATV